MIDKRYLRLTVLPAREQQSTRSCFSRGGGGAGGAGRELGVKQEHPATTRQPPRMGFRIKAYLQCDQWVSCLFG